MYIIYKEYNSDTIFTKTSKHQQLLSGSPAVSLGKLLASYGYTDLAHHLRNFGLITHSDGSFRVVHNERSPYTGPLNQFDFPKASDFFPVPHIKEIYCYYENLDTDEISHSAEVGSTKYNPMIRVSTSYTHNDMFATNTNIYIGDLLAPLLTTSRYLRLNFQQHKMRIGIIGRTELESSTHIMFPIHYDGDEIFTMSIINMDINEKIKFNKIKIARIFKSGINNPVIDITVKDTHTYISANGIVNHNSGTNF